MAKHPTAQGSLAAEASSSMCHSCSDRETRCRSPAGPGERGGIPGVHFIAVLWWEPKGIRVFEGKPVDYASRN